MNAWIVEKDDVDPTWQIEHYRKLRSNVINIAALPFRPARVARRTKGRNTSAFVSTGHRPHVAEVSALVLEAHARFRDDVNGEDSKVDPALPRVPADLFVTACWRPKTASTRIAAIDHDARGFGHSVCTHAGSARILPAGGLRTGSPPLKPPHSIRPAVPLPPHSPRSSDASPHRLASLCRFGQCRGHFGDGLELGHVLGPMLHQIANDSAVPE